MSESRFVRGIDANGQEVECSTEYIDYASPLVGPDVEREYRDAYRCAAGEVVDWCCPSFFDVFDAETSRRVAKDSMTVMVKLSADDDTYYVCYRKGHEAMAARTRARHNAFLHAAKVWSCLSMLGVRHADIKSKFVIPWYAAICAWSRSEDLSPYLPPRMCDPVTDDQWKLITEHKGDLVGTFDSYTDAMNYIESRANLTPGRCFHNTDGLCIGLVRLEKFGGESANPHEKRLYLALQDKRDSRGRWVVYRYPTRVTCCYADMAEDSQVIWPLAYKLAKYFGFAWASHANLVDGKVEVDRDAINRRAEAFESANLPINNLYPSNDGYVVNEFHRKLSWLVSENTLCLDVSRAGTSCGGVAGEVVYLRATLDTKKWKWDVLQCGASAKWEDYALLKVALVAIDDPLDSEQARLIFKWAEPGFVV